MEPQTIKNILITGPPGSGKTTLIRKLAGELRSYDPIGFFTQEIREHGVRKGFGITSLDGTGSVLAHANLRSLKRVGKYGVDIAGFDRFLRSLPLSAPGSRLVVIDEIGKMECFSAYFRWLITALLDSPRPVVATVAMRGSGFIEQIKQRPDSELLTLTERNRDVLATSVVDRIRAVMGF